ncbi:MAG: o-succinylbenzoate synthase [Propionibacteriaceae bacterium]|jgi:O-succinylbenzoate synthase|nr:o-succinylbenzoate synthase [Propionibacteriaceae bacterium]
MKILRAELIRLELPLVAPFVTSFGREDVRHPLLVKLTVDHEGRQVAGWGECVAGTLPNYSSEYLESAAYVLETFLVPLLLEWQQAHGEVKPEDVASAFPHIVGHRMAKAALEMAVLDAWLRLRDQSFASYLGVKATAVPSGVSVGIQPSIEALLEVVEHYLMAGYVRIKIKIEPGWVVEPVKAIRKLFGDIPLQVDANSAFSLADLEMLKQLDDYQLLLIEQPLAEDDIYEHAKLAGQLQTPICLDESIVSLAKARQAIESVANVIINIKPGRVGGYLTAKAIHDYAYARGVPVWCGGMLETGIGRNANAALAGLPGFTLPGDISASNRFYTRDIVPEVEIVDGQIPIYTGPGVSPVPEWLPRV